MARLPAYINRKPDVVAKIHDALAKWRAGEKRNGLRLSEIGGCERYLWAAHTRGEAVPDPEPHALAIFEMGHAVEQMVIGWLELADYPVRDRQETVVMDLGEDLVVLGHLDGVITYQGEPTLLEIKSAKAKRYTECVQKGYEAWNPAYADQLQAYLGAAGLHQALVLVLNKDTSQLYSEKVSADPARYAALRDKALRVLTAEVAPERPYRTSLQAPCRWCPLARQCWDSEAWSLRREQ